MSDLPEQNCLLVAAATPIGLDNRPDMAELLAHCRWLLRSGCHGITLFGTTGEGVSFAAEDRMAALDALVAAGVPANRLIVSIGALNLPEIAKLARHAIERKVAGTLLMPPCLYRGGLTEDGVFRFYDAAIRSIAHQDLRLYLYHFPDICGAQVTPAVVRRLADRHGRIISGVKDSGGSWDFTEALLRRCSHLSIFTGTEVHVPQLLAVGGRGTICGLANVMPRLMRAMFDAPNLFERRKFVQPMNAGDAIVSRWPFIPSLKAVLAAASDKPGWRRVLAPMCEVPFAEEQRLVGDFRRWEISLPPAHRSLFSERGQATSNIVTLRA